jgi:hypothetical protein
VSYTHFKSKIILATDKHRRTQIKINKAGCNGKIQSSGSFANIIVSAFFSFKNTRAWAILEGL